MKKVIFIMLVLIPTSVFGVGGYKDFKWGDDSGKIKQSVPDLRAASGTTELAMQAIFAYQYGERYKWWIPSPLENISAVVTELQSPSQSTVYCFADGKLIAVSVSFLSENVLPSLLKKYGKSKPKAFSYDNSTLETRVWLSDKSRIILYDNQAGFETVTYMAREPYQSAARSLLKQKKLEQSSNLDKLD